MMGQLQRLFIFCIVFISFLFAQTNDIDFESLDVEDGLSQGQVGCILQDNLGFVWFGTHDGLNRFDGYDFSVFRYDPTDSLSISHNFVNALLEDSLGNIWIGTDGGLNLYHRKSGTFKRFLHTENNPKSLSHNLVYDLYFDHWGQLWIATKKGINRYNKSSNSFSRFYVNDPRDNGKSNEIHALEGDKDGSLWLGSYNGLHHFDPQTGETVFYRENKNERNSLSNRQILTLLKDRSGLLWIGSFFGGLNRFDLKTKQFTAFLHNPADKQSLSNNIVKSLLEDAAGNMWVGTEGGGLNLLDQQSGHFRRFFPDKNNHKSLNGPNVLSMYQDRSGIIWLGTDGLNKIDPNLQKFRSVSREAGNGTNLDLKNIYKIIEDQQDNLWIAMDGNGLTRFNRQSKKSTNYRHNPLSKNSISSNRVVAVCEDQAGSIWVGTFGGGLNKYDPVKNTFKVFKKTNDANSISNNYVSCIVKGRNKQLWISTTAKGINRFDPKSEQFTSFIHDPQNAVSLNDNYVWVLYEDRQGTLWAGTKSGGLNKLVDAEQGVFQHFTHSPKDPASLSSNTVYAIYQDSKNNLWVGTPSGLNKFDAKSGTFKKYYQKDGLASDYVSAILEDNSGSLWISSGNGLTKFCPDSNTFKTYEISKGRTKIGYSIWSAFKNSAGEMFFGGSDELTFFHPEQIKDNPYIPPVLITDFQLFNSSVKAGPGSPLKNHILATDKINLNHQQSVMTFNYTALNYTAAQNNLYQYKMEGYDDDWRPLTRNRSITYTNLDPAEYTFHVKASNNDGLWNEKGASLSIIIMPPWWRTWWAYLIYILLGSAALYLFRKSEMHRQSLKYGLEIEKMESEKLKELDHLKSRFFANISHEFRTPLTLILGPLHALQQGVKEQVEKKYAVMERNAQRLLRLINQLLDLSQLEAGKLKLQAQELDIVAFLKRILFSFESLATERNIRFEFNNVLLIGDQKKEELFLYFDPEKMEKILVNLLSNAFKFTKPNGAISVSLFREELNHEVNSETIRIVIKDSGVGIAEKQLPYIFDRFHQVNESAAEASKGSGIGLAFCKELVELHQGELSVKSTPGKGSEFTVTLRTGRKHLKDEQISSEKDKAPQQSATVAEIAEELSAAAPAVPLIIPDKIEDAENAAIVLIVEDNNDMRMYIREQFAKEYQVLEATDGKSGLEKAIENVPDLIISDVMMPAMDGYQLCDELKNNEATSHIPVILLTAKSSGESKIEGLQLGADDYLTKPFDARELKVRAKNLIEQRKKLRERFTKTVMLQPAEIAVTSADEKFLQRAMDVVNESLSDEKWDVEMFASKMAMSRMQLHRKLKALVNQSATEFIRSLRLQRALVLIEGKTASISEISYQVGFSSPAHFSKVFKEHFGKAPSEHSAPTNT